jgi:hypothetical protein
MSGDLDRSRLDLSRSDLDVYRDSLGPSVSGFAIQAEQIGLGVPQSRIGLECGEVRLGSVARLHGFDQ